MKEYLTELHIHTVLSPCGDLMMTPANILTTACLKGIDLLAITDHNSAENLQVMLELAKDYGIHVLPGMEVESKEEVHLIALFDHLDQVLALQETIYQHLPLLENDEEFFGPQLLTNLSDDYVDRVYRLLAISTDMAVEEVVQEVERLGGLVYPAHVDRQQNSILTQLGFIPPDLNLLALEVTPRYLENAILNPLLQGFPLLPARDVHYLHDLVGSVVFELEEPTIVEIKRALLGEDGRSYRWRRS